MKNFHKLHYASLCVLFFSPHFAAAEEAHEHGVTKMNMAIDGGSVEIELEAPGADIVGFEYMAKSDEDKKAIEMVLKTLHDPNNLVIFPKDAGCSLNKAHADLESEHGHDDHDDHKDEHDHDDHKDEHEHDEHKDEESHTEFHGQYSFTCSDVDKLAQFSFPYFETFKNAKEIELQVVTSKGAKAYEVARDNSIIQFSE